MARICGFHPQDPGSIPGVDECPGMTLKAFQRMYPRGLRARSYRTDVSLVRIQSCVKCPSEGTLIKKDIGGDPIASSKGDRT